MCLFLVSCREAVLRLQQHHVIWYAGCVTAPGKQHWREGCGTSRSPYPPREQPPVHVYSSAVAADQIAPRGSLAQLGRRPLFSKPFSNTKSDK